MPKRILKVLKKMGDGLEAANTGGAMNTTEQKKRIILGEEKRVSKTPKSKKNSKKNTD